ncbi:MAG: fatty acid--CoA ligase family protein [Novosphingobium sp.]|nr:fatty acid--CoA ligase family protein [Novosphingobium sp.]
MTGPVISAGKAGSGQTELQQIAAQALLRGADYPAIEWQGSWISWKEMRRIAERVTGLLDRGGVPAGAPVAMVPRNRVGAVAALVGLIATGHSICMIHVYQSDAGIVRDIARLRPAALVTTDEDQSAEVSEALREGAITGITVSGMDAQFIPDCEPCGAVFEPSPRPRIEVLTSGTTGKPRQFTLSFDLIARDMIGMNATNHDAGEDLRHEPPAFLFYPFGNFSGLYSNLASILRGVPAVLVDRFSLEGWHDYVLRHRPVWGGLPPSAIQMILDADIPPEDFASIGFFTTGAAPVDPAAHREFERRYAKPLFSIYGATEFGGPVTAMTLEMWHKWEGAKFGSVGVAGHGARLRIVDPESGAALPAGDQGLLEVISPRIGPDWIRTSDLGLIDQDGFVFLRGRADDAILRGGFKIHPSDIENALCTHPAVIAAGVTGVADTRLGQVPGAAVVLRPEFRKPQISELEAHLRSLVKATDIPVHWSFVDALPRTAMLKVDRVALRMLFEDAD